MTFGGEVNAFPFDTGARAGERSFSNAPKTTVSDPRSSGRAEGVIRVTFKADGGYTHVQRLLESGGLRLRFPRPQGGCEAVVLNTAGGMAEGDHACFDVHAGAGSRATLVTQSAERIYRSEGTGSVPATRVDVRLRLEEGASLRWLPQETILFDRARLSRRLDAELAADATLTIFESYIFGRLAAGETQISGSLHDRWRVRRAGRLAFADDLRLEGAIASILDRAACGAGARACASLLHVAPDAEGMVEGARTRLATSLECEWGASTWNGMLVVRLVSRSPQALRKTALEFLDWLPGGGAPRLWR